MIHSIEVICKPCHKCELLIERLNRIMECIEFVSGVKMKYEFIHNENALDAAKYGYAVNKLPLLIINGNVELVGHVKEEHIIRKKLEEILKSY